MINNARVTQPMGTAARASQVTDIAMPAGRATLGWTVRAHAPVTTVCATLGQMERGTVWSASQATSGSNCQALCSCLHGVCNDGEPGALHVHMSGCHVWWVGVAVCSCQRGYSVCMYECFEAPECCCCVLPM